MNWRDLPVIVGYLAIVFFVSYGVSLLPGASGQRDDSDPPGGHSGMTIYTDNLTGCQYLKTGDSSLTPRLDRNAKQICKDTTK